MSTSFDSIFGAVLARVARRRTWGGRGWRARLQRLRIATLALLLCSEHVAVAPMGNAGQPCSSEGALGKRNAARWCRKL